MSLRLFILIIVLLFQHFSFTLAMTRGVEFQTCKDFFTGFEIAAKAKALQIPRASIENASFALWPSDVLGSAGETLLLDVSSAGSQYTKFQKVLQKKASRKVSNQVRLMLINESNMALKGHVLLDERVDGGTRVIFINNSLIKRLNTIKNLPYTNSINEKLLEMENMLKEGMFYRNYKSSAFMSQKLTLEDIHSKLLKPIRLFLFRELRKDKEIIKAFGDKAKLWEAIVKHVTAGVGMTFEGASVASRISVVRGGKSAQFSAERLYTILKEAFEIEEGLPAIYKNEDGVIKQGLIRTIRKAPNREKESVLELLRYEDPALAEELTAENLKLVIKHLEYMNILDWYKPSILPEKDALKIIELLGETNNQTKENLSEALQIFLQNPVKVQEYIQGEISKGDVRFVMAFDVMNLGAFNYGLMRNGAKKIIDYIENGLEAEESKRTMSKNLQLMISNILNESSNRIKRYLSVIEEKLHQRGFSNFTIQNEGDEIYVLLKRQKGAIKAMQAILNETRYLRAAGIVVRSKGSQKVAETMIKLAYLMDINKKFELHGAKNIIPVSLDNKIFVFSPDGTIPEALRNF